MWDNGVKALDFVVQPGSHAARQPVCAAKPAQPVCLGFSSAGRCGSGVFMVYGHLHDFFLNYYSQKKRFSEKNTFFIFLYLSHICCGAQVLAFPNI